MNERLNIHANRVGAWESRVLPKEYRDPQTRFTRALEEVDELEKAVTVFDGSKEKGKEVAEEATDVIIRMLGLIVQVGGNPDILISTKIDEIGSKYHPPAIQQLYDKGLTYPQAMAERKRTWKKH